MTMKNIIKQFKSKRNTLTFVLRNLEVNLKANKIAAIIKAQEKHLACNLSR